VPKLKLKRVAEEQLDALPDHVYDEVEEKLLRIQADPRDEGDELIGKLAGRWKARVGGYRIVYRILEGGSLVMVDAIKTRGKSY
jgi:mRNA-degrading endonuclease RelE of RelBE toxin-antitoxin system